MAAGGADSGGLRDARNEMILLVETGGRDREAPLKREFARIAVISTSLPQFRLSRRILDEK